jgi:hypothetical protein
LSNPIASPGRAVNADPFKSLPFILPLASRADTYDKIGLFRFVLKELGMKLPHSGSSMTLFSFLLAISTFAGALAGQTPSFRFVGPQKRLFLPAPSLKKGKNEIIIFDLHQTKPAPVKGATSLKDETEK